MARNTMPKAAASPKLACGLPEGCIGTRPELKYYLKKIRISAKDNPAVNTYIQIVSPDGKVLNTCWFLYADFIPGQRAVMHWRVRYKVH